MRPETAEGRLNEMDSEYSCAGDIVMLRSGGPWMTVEDTEDGEVHCSYFVEGHLEHATFREEALLKLFEAEPADEPADEPGHSATDD
ncbi:MAG: DUF2158 domain-containing protein [Gemmatimonadetes bacterium]|nr:DUF2158 domain-containing protein [Gemmatimonadota bacterium]